MTFTFQRIQEDVRRQIQATHQILDAIEKLNHLAESIPEEENRRQIEATIKILAGVSDSLMDNAGSTSKFIREVAS